MRIKPQYFFDITSQLFDWGRGNERIMIPL